MVALNYFLEADVAMLVLAFSVIYFVKSLA